MKIREAIDRADELCHNTYTDEQKIKWLSALDDLIYRQIVKTHDYIIQQYSNREAFPEEGEAGIAYYSALTGEYSFWNGAEYSDISAFIGYDDSTDTTKTTLIAYGAFAEMYIYWLLSKIALSNDEIDRYNNYALIYDTHFDNFKNYYNETHKPKRTARERYW